MGIVAWIVLGLGAALLATMVIPGRRSRDLILTCAAGVARALLGGWLATRLFHAVTLRGFFNRWLVRSCVRPYLRSPEPTGWRRDA